jgi:EamA domain-containing membrane protein RarD
MKKNLFILSLLLSCFTTSIPNAKADDGDYSNIWVRSDMQEHMATSYALSFTSYMIYRKEFEMTPESSVLLSTLTGLALGLVRDQFLFHHDHLGSYMEANAIGATASMFLTYSFKF